MRRYTRAEASRLSGGVEFYMAHDVDIIRADRDDLVERLRNLEAERDALAARNAELHDVAGILLCIDQCETCREEGEFNRDGVKRVINREAPASLVRRDAELILKLADQLEEAEAPDALGGDMWDASQCADWIREQAEGGGDE